MEQTGQPIRYWKYEKNNWEVIDGRVVTEMSVALSVNGEIWLTFMCSPIDLKELGVGFLFNEGIIETADEVVSARICEQECNIDIWLNRVVDKPDHWQRTSGCTGGLTRSDNEQRSTLFTLDEQISPKMVLESMEQLIQIQELYRQTRGVHCSVMSDGHQMLIRAEDIGRHNTLDKLAGHFLLGRYNPKRRIILTTGRISSEMLQKSARLGASVVVSRTSPTSRAVQRAEELGITLIGYARRNQFIVYAHPERLVEPGRIFSRLPETVKVAG